MVQLRTAPHTLPKSTRGLLVVKGPVRRTVARNQSPITWHHWRGSGRYVSYNTSAILTLCALPNNPVHHSGGRQARVECAVKHEALILSFPPYWAQRPEPRRNVQGCCHRNPTALERFEQGTQGMSKDSLGCRSCVLYSSSVKRRPFIPTTSFLSWGCMQTREESRPGRNTVFGGHTGRVTMELNQNKPDLGIQGQTRGGRDTVRQTA